MKISEAIAILTEIESKYLPDEEYSAFFERKEAITKAKEALSKQIPMKPKHIDKNGVFDGNFKKVCPTCGRALMERVTNSERSYPRLYNMSGYCWCGQKIDLEGNEAVPLGQTVVPWVRAKDRLPIEEWKQRQDIDGDTLPVLVCRVDGWIPKLFEPQHPLHRYIQTACFDGEHFRDMDLNNIDVDVEYWGPFPEYPAGVSAYEEIEAPKPPPMAGSDE